MKNTILALTIGAVILVGGGYLAYTNFSNPNPSGDVATKENQKTEKDITGTFASFIARGQNLECTFEQNDGINVSSGRVYLANDAKQIRGDFIMQQSGVGPAEAHMIRDGGYNYLWGSMFPQGIKSVVTAEEQGKLFSTKNGDIDEDTTFNCKPWTVDGSIFSRPGNIEFHELNIKAGQMDSGLTIDDLETVKKQECDAKVCNQAPEGIPRQQCLQALGC